MVSKSDFAKRAYDDKPIDDYAKAVSSDKPIYMGTLVTRVMVTEREPLLAADKGMTVGQLIDERIENMQRQMNVNNTNPDDRSDIHSITFEFPRG